MLLDTNIIIDLFRQSKPAVIAFDKLLYGQNASIITKFELMVGEESDKLAKRTAKMLQNLRISFIPVNEQICREAEKILTNFYHSKGIDIEDAFIAATALANNEELATRNVKHFEFIPNLKVFKPY